MTVSVMITGSLAKQPTRRTSKNGNAYLTASMRVTAGNETEWWNLLCFTESGQAEIIRLEVGEKLSCQGALKLELYRASDGEQKISRTIIADGVLTLRPAPRERKPRASVPGASDGASQGPSNDGGPNDAIPF
jgi:single-stranded DNA-binding protein